MSTTRSRQVTMFLLVLGAVVFGMVLAGGLGLTVPGATQASNSNLSASQAAAATMSSTRGLPTFADLAEAVDPAVVSIQATTIEKASAQRFGRRRGIGGNGGNGGTDPFEFFFGPRGRGERPGAPGAPGGGDQSEDNRSDAGGSGFVISRDGLVVTNNHVVEGATAVKVHLGDRDYMAKVQGTDAATDLALLKIDAGNNLKFLDLGDSDRTRVGDWVMVIGNPLNLNKTVTTGVVSAKGRTLGISEASFENFLQTDAAINFGNSGGPLVNLEGQVVGIATAISYGSENIGFAVPVNTLKSILPQLREKGKVTRGYLGIVITNLDYAHAQAFGLPSTDGALVSDVQPGTHAAEAGVEHGDIIVSVDGRHIKDTRDLINYVSAKGPNSSVTLSLLRNGKTIDRQVKLGERPPLNAQQNGEDRPERESGINWLGLQYQDLDQNTRGSFGLPSGVNGIVITNVSPSSPLYEQAVRPGNVITEVNGEAVKGVSDFERIVRSAKSKSYLRMYTMRFGQRGESLPPIWAVVQVP
jgi:serine protease Do